MASSRTDRIAVTTAHDGLTVRLECVSQANHLIHPLLGESSQRIFRSKIGSSTVRSLTIAMARESSKVMPLDREIKTGPSGIQVQVSFMQQQQEDSLSLLTNFRELLADLAEAQILPGPFGVSLEQHRLHRLVSCDSFSCTAHIPLEGAHAVASTESFRKFLPSKVGVFSVASPSNWSTWWMANAPQSLNDARNVMNATPKDATRSIHPVRPARWMQWDFECNGEDGSCHYSVTQGVQYDLLAWDLQQLTVPTPLSSLLPPATSSILSIDPLADETHIEIDKDLKVSSSVNNLVLKEEDTDDAIYRYGISSMDLDLSQVTLQSRPISHDTPRCSIHSRILRDHGQANTGSLELYLENQCEDSCNVRVEQELPLFLSPRWRSLRILAGGHAVSLGDLDHIAFHDDGSSKITLHTNATTLRLILDYDPVFLSIDSFPGDANRGFELPSAKALFQCRPNAVLYTDTQLLLAPLPDMSMPFNVISLTCTFYAFIVGSILNLAIKKASKHVKDQLDPENAEPDSVLGKIRAKVVKIVGSIAGKIRRVDQQ